MATACGTPTGRDPVTLWKLVAPGYPPIGLNTAQYTFLNAEAATLVARLTSPPTDARKRLIDALIGSLKTGGVWSKLDAFYMLAAADAQSSLLNWVSTSYNLTAVNSPAFVTDRGYTGDGSTSYLETSFNPTTAPSPKFVQDSAHAAVWSRTNLPNGAGDSFEFGSSNSYIARAVSLSGRGVTRPNAASAQLIGNAAYPGYAAWARSAAAVWEAYSQGADSGGGTTASAAPINTTFAILRSRDGSFGANQIATAHFGSNLTAGEVASAYTAIQTYLQAIGAA
jgi:hypothetical protein